MSGRSFTALIARKKGRAWLDIPYKLDDASTKALKRIPKGAGIVNVIVTGVFMSGGHFGHMNGYPYLLIARQVSNVKILQSCMTNSETEQKAEKKWACGGANPK